MTHLKVKLRLVGGRDPPYDHNFLLGSAFYNLIRIHSEEVSSAIHDSPRRSPYVLSELFRVRGVPHESWFRVGMSNLKLATLVKESLSSGTALSIGESRYEVVDVDMDEIPCNPGEYLTLSPILLRDRITGRSIVCDSSAYCQTLESAMNTQVLNNLRKNGSLSVKHFEPMGVRKRTIKDRTVLAQKGRMLINGPMEELKFLVDHGVGLSPALAFGLIVPTDRMDLS